MDAKSASRLHAPQLNSLDRIGENTEAMQKTKTCKDCGLILPESRDYFGQYKNTRSNGEVVIGFRNSCRQCMAAHTAKHKAENPHQVQRGNQLRLERASKSGGCYTDADLDAIRKALGNCCRFCGESLKCSSHVEHLTTVSRGGSSYPKNITLSCEKCNLAKTNKTLAEFMAWRKERSLPIREISPSYEAPDQPIGKAGRTTA